MNLYSSQDSLKQKNTFSIFWIIMTIVITFVIGLTIGNVNSKGNHYISEQKDDCEKELPRNKMCELESINFRIVSK